ncbi:peptidase S9 [Caulobacter sp. Root487D2Y]|uniref:S9 family peptidase n=1 Tax=Caulobacter sp. Root487D2Y TaxID=1736547 RepID=UPI0006FF05F0|nr:S9 family peptidase [Caulobacter sp. Root487D2Y]KQY30095.1 peptidase S9 [Caulobacter sp. Root487D2Y]
MTKTLRIAASALALSMAAFAVAPGALAADAQGGRGFTAKDMVQLERISDPRVSPDGRFVVYSVRTMDLPANKASMSLWIADLKAKTAPRRLAVSDGGASSARWSPDGKGLYFISGRTGGLDQVYRTDAAGETAVQATKAPFDVGAFKIAPDGKTIVIAQSVFPDCDTLDCTKDKLAAKAGVKTTGVVFDKLFIRHWDAWNDGLQNHLYALKLGDQGLATGTPVALMNGFNGDTPTKPFGGDEDFNITPDGKWVVFSAKPADREESWSTNYDLWRVPMDGSAKPENRTQANKAMDSQPSFSPDGRISAYLAMKRPGFEADRLAIMVREADAKDAKGYGERELTAGWDRSAQSIAWSADGKTIYTTAEDVGQTKLFAIDVKSGKVTPLTGEGHVSGFSVGPQSIVYAQDNLKSPAQLYALSTVAKKAEAPIKLTNNNAEALAGVAMGDTEQFSFPGWNGETVHGYLVKPANFDPAKTYPVAFLIHGGPQGSFGNLFHYRWNAQTYAGAGYAVVMIDFHGSTGYGQAFTDAISQHWGDRPLEDLQKGWAFATGKYGFLDKDRACALGGSYGGFMINWIASQWKAPWKCLVNHDGIFDSRFMGYSTEELWFSEWENGGPPYAANTTYSKFNPADHVDQWSVPEMVVQGGQDFRVPLEEGIGTFTALQRKGVPSKLLYFPNENHWVLKAQNSVQWHDEVQKWLDRWTKGEPAK